MALPKKLLILFLSGLFVVISSQAYSSTESSKIIWTAVFSNFTPIKKGITQSYCKSHTPSVIVTTIKSITSNKGINGLNGVNIRYISYKTIKKDNLYFNIVNAVVSGKSSNEKHWSEPMKLYEQTLSPVGVTYTVWSTPNCKGTFLGTPTIVK